MEMDEKNHIRISRRDLLIFFIGAIVGFVASHIFVFAVAIGILAGYIAYPYLKGFVLVIERVLAI
jgi:hypothetical protein